MIRICTFFHRCNNWLKKKRLQPIRVFCLHHVCDEFEPSYMYKEDWMATDDFKNKINNLKKDGYSFISLTDAYNKVKHDVFRFKKYAVITFDDGYSSVKSILPWLHLQGISVTLFVNADYADGKAYRITPNEKYLTRNELESFDVEVGLHGILHQNAAEMTESEFNQFVQDTVNGTKSIKGYIPFWAYTWGRHSDNTDRLLKKNNLIPVLIDGGKNYNDTNFIHRELLK